MASSRILAQPGLKQCYICCENVNRVKVLPCSHPLCITCLATLISETNSSSCPKCRSPIDGEKIDQFPWRYFGLVSCDLCLELKDVDDMWYCPACAMSICSKCVITEHKKLDEKSHELTPWSSPKLVEGFQSSVSPVAMQSSMVESRKKVSEFLMKVEIELLQIIETRKKDTQKSLCNKLALLYGSTQTAAASEAETEREISNEWLEKTMKSMSKAIQLTGTSTDYNVDNGNFDANPKELASLLMTRIQLQKIPCIQKSPPAIASTSFKDQLKLQQTEVPTALQNLTKKLVIEKLNESDEAVEEFMAHFSRLLWKNSDVKELVIKDSRVLCRSDFDKTCKSMSKLKLITVKEIIGRKNSISFIPSQDGSSLIQQYLQNIVDKRGPEISLRTVVVNEKFITEFVHFMHGKAALESLNVSTQDFVCHRQDFWHCCETLPNLTRLVVNDVPIGSSPCKYDLLNVISQGRIITLGLGKILMDEEFVTSFIQIMQGHPSLEWLTVSRNEILKTRPDFWDCLLTFKSLKELRAGGIVIPMKQKEALRLKSIVLDGY